MKFNCPNPECGQSLEVDESEMGDYKFNCPKCGQQIEFEAEPSTENAQRKKASRHPSSFALPSGTQSCPKCRLKISEDAKKCSNCGSIILNRSRHENVQISPTREQDELKGRGFLRQMGCLVVVLVIIFITVVIFRQPMVKQICENRIIGVFRPLAVVITSQEIKKSYTPVEWTRFEHLNPHKNVVTGITAIDGFSFLVIKITTLNRTALQQQFNSDQFRLLDNNGRIVKANLVGIGQGFAMPDYTVSVEGTKGTRGGISYKGNLGGGKSFVEWDLAPHESHSETLVFLVSTADKGIHCEFK